MPVIKSAKKKLRQDKKRTKNNYSFLKVLKDSIKRARKENSKENIINAVKNTDKAVKKNIIHKNKAARIKSSLSKLVGTKEAPKTNIKKKKKLR